MYIPITREEAVKIFGEDFVNQLDSENMGIIRYSNTLNNDIGILKIFKDFNESEVKFEEDLSSLDWSNCKYEYYLN